MTGKLFAILTLLSVNKLVFGGLAEEKEKAYKRMEMLDSAVGAAYDQVSDMFNNRAPYLDMFKNNKKDQGLSMRELSLAEMNRIADGSGQKADHSSNPSKVKDCVQEKKEKAVSKVEAYTKNFTKAVDDLREKAKGVRLKVTHDWQEEYYAVKDVYFAQYETFRNAIEKTNSTAYVLSAVKHLEQIVNRTITHTLSLESKLVDLEISFDRTLAMGPVNDFKYANRKIVDNFLEAVANCFITV